jgi:hypothetical protein
MRDLGSRWQSEENLAGALAMLNSSISPRKRSAAKICKVMLADRPAS